MDEEQYAEGYTFGHSDADMCKEPVYRKRSSWVRGHTHVCEIIDSDTKLPVPWEDLDFAKGYVAGFESLNVQFKTEENEL